MKYLHILIVIALSTIPAFAKADTARVHGLSVFGDLKYPPDFTHFDYANAAAPKGGRIKIPALDSFETVQPFTLKGRKEILAETLLYDTLLARSFDEPDSYYGLVAKTIEIPVNKKWVAFNINPRARFHDGNPITADDVLFTFKTLIKDGHPKYRIKFRDVAEAKITSKLRIKFIFNPGPHRDLPTQLATLPVLSKSYYEKNTFNKTTFIGALASGPYKIKEVKPGRAIKYSRVSNYWGKDLPVNRGRYNFDTIEVDYYRDREVAFQAFFSNQYDFREDFTSRQWATQYNKPPVNKGFIVREVLPDETPSGVQAFVFNLRKKKFQDIGVRKALDLAFDFEWTNKTLFFSQYTRTNSMFENSPLAAHSAPSQSEIALLKPYRGKIPEEVFRLPFVAPKTSGSGHIRKNLRKAQILLKEAGYSIKKGRCVDTKGRPLQVEFLLFEGSFKRIINPYIRNLKRLGIGAHIRIVDIANFKRRADDFDFDVLIRRIVQPLTPGLEQRNYFSSQYANVRGSSNIGGINDPVIDALVEKVINADSRANLQLSVRVLDRVLMWNRFVVTQWYKGVHNVAYWNKFNRPKVSPKYNLGVLDTWWYDAQKAAMLKAGKVPPLPATSLPPPARSKR